MQENNYPVLTPTERRHQEVGRPPLFPARFCCRGNIFFFSLSTDICQEHDENRLHLPGAGSAAARLSDVSLGGLHGPRCSVSAAGRRTTAISVIQIQFQALNVSQPSSCYCRRRQIDSKSPWCALTTASPDRGCVSTQLL